VAGRTHTKRGAGPGEIAMYRVLAFLAPACNDHFTALLLPTAISIDPGRGLLVLPHYEGEDLAARWNESDGGARLGPSLATAIPAVLADLARIDTAGVTADPVLSTIPGLVFDHTAALTRSAGLARQLTRAGLLSPENCAQAERLLAHQQRTPMIVNNGDFYPRNLIVQPGGRIVIVDWETCNPNSPFHTIDHPENVAAVFYVHMWGNPAWQAAYRNALHQRFGFSPASFAQGVVIQALELANMWMNDTDRHLAAIQASIIISVLAEAPDH
jgi:aminoglycoside phosphotransferase (APT) family kinase protein